MFYQNIECSFLNFIKFDVGMLALKKDFLALLRKVKIILDIFVIH
jgi:hypothetical protein